MTDQPSLENLLVSEEGLNEDVLAGVLAPYIQIGSETGAFVPTEEFGSLNTNQQTAVFLLYRRAAESLDLIDTDRATPREISEASGLNHSSVKGAVRKLDNQGLVNNDDGSYWVPTYNYDSIRDFIQGE